MSGWRLEVVKYLIEDVNADISCQDMNGFTPLHLAAQFATLELVQYLIEERHCDEGCRNKYGITPLHCAAGGRL